MLGVLVLVVAIAALREPGGHSNSAAGGRTSASSVAKNTSTHASAPTRSGHSTAPAGGAQSTDAVKRVPLVVLNNTTIHGLATQAARRFESGGWTVTRSGNLTNDIISTCAYYDDSDPAAEAAAEALRRQYPTIKRVEPKFAQLPSGPVVVVLTPDYSPT